MTKPRAVIACGGVGIAQRGFETFTRECFDALSKRDDVDIVLVKGRGARTPRERVAPTLHRDGRAAAALGRVLRRDPYWVEQVGFSASLLPLLARRRPQVVFVSEWSVGKMLARWKRLSGAGFSLLLSNAGPYPPDWLGHVDHLHQLTPHELEAAVAAGFPREHQTLLEYGFDLPAAAPPLDAHEQAALRERLDLPRDRPIVLAVAALAFHHKRLDYLVEEVARLPSPRPYLVMLGQREPETPALLDLADSALGSDGFAARTVRKDEVADYYRAADVFAHVSLWEAFGRVLVEALAHGLACVVHDGPTQRFVLGEHATFGDFTRSGELAGLLSRVLQNDGGKAVAVARARYVHERYAWERLAPRYVDMLRTAAQTARVV